MDSAHAAECFICFLCLTTYKGKEIRNDGIVRSRGSLCFLKPGVAKMFPLIKYRWNKAAIFELSSRNNASGARVLNYEEA